MLILFLDDQTERHELAEKYLSKANHKTLHAFSAIEGLELIRNCQTRIGLALLDHDLFDIIEEPENIKLDRNGVWFLAQMFANIQEDKWPTQYHIHSYNPDGVKNMLADLRNKDQVCSADPFSGDMLTRLIARIQPQ
jgi:CheY-like chemotaxis protein